MISAKNAQAKVALMVDLVHQDLVYVVHVR